MGGAIYIGSGEDAVGAGSVVTHRRPRQYRRCGKSRKSYQKNYNRVKVNRGKPQAGISPKCIRLHSYVIMTTCIKKHVEISLMRG